MSKIKPALVSLITIKELVAKKYNKESWNNIQRDYEYGMGVSKLIGFEELMDIVAEHYMEANKLKASKKLNNKVVKVPELFLTDDFNTKLTDVITKTDKVIALLTTSSKTIKKKYKK